MGKLIFMGYLLWSSVQDRKEMQVVRYTHLLGIFAVVCSGWSYLRSMATTEELVVMGLAAACLIFTQLLAWKCRMYGMADVIVFCLTGLLLLFEKGITEGIMGYLYVHAVSGGMLGVVQWGKGNLKGVRLKQPIPYIPYISVAFFLTNMVL